MYKRKTIFSYWQMDQGYKGQIGWRYYISSKWTYKYSCWHILRLQTPYLKFLCIWCRTMGPTFEHFNINYETIKHSSTWVYNEICHQHYSTIYNTITFSAVHCSTHWRIQRGDGDLQPPFEFQKIQEKYSKTKQKKKKRKRRATVVYNLLICLIFMLIHVYRMNNHIMIFFLQNFTFISSSTSAPFKENVDSRLAPPIHLQIFSLW